MARTGRKVNEMVSPVKERVYRCPRCHRVLGTIVNGGAGLHAGGIVVPWGEIVCHNCGWRKTWGRAENRLADWLDKRYGNGRTA